ncbi:MAG TPA: VWA domain-containing protein [Terriglobia bacterium]|nr:VWA domain-containing protein [Terriglobia bacterium]
MKRNCDAPFALTIALFATLALAMTAPAQTPAPAAPANDPGMVFLDVSVVDKNGDAIPELTAANFEIREDNARQRIASFAVADGPISIGVSWPPSLPVGDTLIELLKASNPGTEFFIVSNDTVVRSFTTDIKQARVALAQGNHELYPSDGRDGIRIGMDVLTEASAYTRRILLLLRRPLAVQIATPSVDVPILGTIKNLPGAGRENSYATLMNSAMQQGTQVYAILVEGTGAENVDLSCQGPSILGISPSNNRAPIQVYHSTEDEGPTCQELPADDADKQATEAESLDALARHTGGRSYWVTAPEKDVVVDTGGLELVASRISRALRVQYRIGYVPTNTARDGKWRKVEVSVVPPNKAIAGVWAKDGYYAPKDRKKN